MKKKQKILWSTAKSFLLGGFIFWFWETIVFLIIEGWHIKATNKYEIWCDNVAENMFTTGVMLTIYVCLNYLFKWS